MFNIRIADMILVNVPSLKRSQHISTTSATSKSSDQICNLLAICHHQMVGQIPAGNFPGGIFVFTFESPPYKSCWSWLPFPRMAWNLETWKSSFQKVVLGWIQNPNAPNVWFYWPKMVKKWPHEQGNKMEQGEMATGKYSHPMEHM